VKRNFLAASRTLISSLAEKILPRTERSINFLNASFWSRDSKRLFSEPPQKVPGFAYFDSFVIVFADGNNINLA